jgi:hypothetical protein
VQRRKRLHLLPKLLLQQLQLLKQRLQRQLLKPHQLLKLLLLLRKLLSNLAALGLLDQKADRLTCLSAFF